MKILQTLTLLLLAGTAHAQPGPGAKPPPLSQVLTEHQAELGVTDAQVAQVSTIEEQYRAELEALEAESQALHEQIRAEVEAVLDEETLQALQALRPEQRDDTRGRRR